MQAPCLPRREALQQASASCCTQNASRAYVQGHHVGVVVFGGMSDMLGRELRLGEKRSLLSKAELFPHVIDRHGLSLPTFPP